MEKAAKEKLRDLAFINAFISIVDNKRVIIENIDRIVECNDITAEINASGFCIRVWGSELSLSNYDNSTIEINGIITSIELEKQSRLKGK